MNFLVSYAFIKRLKATKAYSVLIDLLLGISPYANVLIDCGAFSNFQNRLRAAAGQKVFPPIEIDDYLAFCQNVLHGHVWQYIALDVVRDPDATNRNLQMMLDAGLKPMPVYIEGYQAADLERLLAFTNRICVAGGVGSSDAYITNRYRTIYEMSGSRAKIHGLGYGRFPTIFQVPLASADSSAYNTGGRWGNFSLYHPQKGFQNIGWRDLSKDSDLPVEKRRQYIAYLHDNCHVPYSEINKPEQWLGQHCTIGTLVTCYSYLRFLWHVSQSGRDYFLAASNKEWLTSPIAALKCENTQRDGLDIIEAQKWFLHLRSLYNHNHLTTYVQEVVDVLKEQTEWALLPHSL